MFSESKSIITECRFSC